MAHIKVTLSKDGNVKTEAFGYTGDSCLEATKKLYSRFGTASVEAKEEMYIEEIEQTQTIGD